APAQDGDQPHQRLPWFHRRRGQPGRHERHARAGRPADSRHRPYPPALLVRRRRRHGRGPVPPPDHTPPGPEGPRARSAPGCGLRAARQLEQKILELGADRVAAFIAEPIQGAGGVIVPPVTYWPEIQRIVDQYGILLVVDEVICGFGRTGEWFGSQYYGIRPDLMPIAKGMTSGYLPMGGVIVGDRVASCLIDQGGEFFHGYTYSGHPVAAAVGLENLRILREEGIVDYAREQAAPYLQQKTAALAEHPLVGQVRGVGMLGALELVRDKRTRERFPGKGAAGTLCRDL